MDLWQAVDAALARRRRNTVGMIESLVLAGLLVVVLLPPIRWHFRWRGAEQRNTEVLRARQPS